MRTKSKVINVTGQKRGKTTMIKTHAITTNTNEYKRTETNIRHVLQKYHTTCVPKFTKNYNVQAVVGTFAFKLFHALIVHQPIQ